MASIYNIKYTNTGLAKYTLMTFMINNLEHFTFNSAVHKLTRHVLQPHHEDIKKKKGLLYKEQVL
jgi:hypothetical protein